MEELLKRIIIDEIALLEKWISETKSYGWSTQHVGEMERRTSLLRDVVYKIDH